MLNKKGFLNSLGARSGGRKKIKNCHGDWDVKNGQIHGNMFLPACVRPFPNGLKYMLSVEVFVKAYYWLCFFSCELKFSADRALGLYGLNHSRLDVAFRILSPK